MKKIFTKWKLLSLPSANSKKRHSPQTAENRLGKEPPEMMETHNLMHAVLEERCELLM